MHIADTSIQIPIKINNYFSFTAIRRRYLENYKMRFVI